jgi:hypothetical protein
MIEFRSTGGENPVSAQLGPQAIFGIDIIHEVIFPKRPELLMDAYIQERAGRYSGGHLHDLSTALRSLIQDSDSPSQER